MTKKPNFFLDPKRPFSSASPFGGFGNIWGLKPQDFRNFLREEMFTPVIDVFETKKEVVMTAELPGVKKEDLSLKITENEITLSVQKKEKHETETKEKGQYMRAFSSRFQGYSRTITLPAKTIASKAKAIYKNGVLEVRAPKIHPAPLGKERVVKIE